MVDDVDHTQGDRHVGRGTHEREADARRALRGLVPREPTRAEVLAATDPHGAPRMPEWKWTPSPPIQPTDLAKYGAPVAGSTGRANAERGR